MENNAKIRAMGDLSSSTFQIFLVLNSKAHRRKNKISSRYDTEGLLLPGVHGSSLLNFTDYYNWDVPLLSASPLRSLQDMSV